jgi:hypothetical protein
MKLLVLSTTSWQCLWCHRWSLSAAVESSLCEPCKPQSFRTVVTDEVGSDTLYSPLYLYSLMQHEDLSGNEYGNFIWNSIHKLKPVLALQWRSGAEYYWTLFGANITFRNIFQVLFCPTLLIIVVLSIIFRCMSWEEWLDLPCHNPTSPALAKKKEGAYSNGKRLVWRLT